MTPTIEELEFAITRMALFDELSSYLVSQAENAGLVYDMDSVVDQSLEPELRDQTIWGETYTFLIKVFYEDGDQEEVHLVIQHDDHWAAMVSVLVGDGGEPPCVVRDGRVSAVLDEMKGRIDRAIDEVRREYF